MDDDRDFLLVALVVVAVLGAIAGFTALALYRSGPTWIVVDGRWWAAETRVRYDLTTVEMVPVSQTVCSGFGESRSCSVQTHFEARTKTTTYTRCASQAQGTELPVTYPAPACEMWDGDYLSYSDGRTVAFHLEDGDEAGERAFSPALWDGLEPGSAARVRWNGFGVIVEVLDGESQP